jgi:hypothetical protein
MSVRADEAGAGGQFGLNSPVSLPWTAADRDAVERALAANPPDSGRCELVAAELVGIATGAGWGARRRTVEIVEGFVAAKFIHPRCWPNLGWQYHVLAETREHGVDAITGAGDHEIESYLADLWVFPECLRLGTVVG